MRATSIALSARTVAGGLVLVALGGLASAAGALEVHAHTAHGVDLSLYQSWDWMARPGQDPTSGGPLVAEPVRDAVERRLVKAGLERARTGGADLLVIHHVRLDGAFDLSRAPYGSLPSTEGAAFSAGTLVVDLVDAASGSLVWRGWAVEALSRPGKDRAGFEKRVDKVVRRILKRLAP